MQECSFNIETHDFKVIVCCKHESNADACDLCYRGVRGSIVFRALTKTLGDQVSLLFAFDYRTIWVKLVSVTPSKSDSLAIRGKSCSLKGMAFFETIKFTTHGSMPYLHIWMGKSFMI